MRQLRALFCQNHQDELTWEGWYGAYGSDSGGFALN